jgi:hypothetical protein
VSDAKIPSELASKAAEAIRDLNHATLSYAAVLNAALQRAHNATSPLTYED